MEDSIIRIVFAHVDYIRYCTKRRAKIAEAAKLKKDYMEEGVVLFCCSEKVDEENPNNVIENATSEIIRRLEMVKTKRVMIYPYAHFTSDLSNPETAIKILIGLENSLKELDLEVKRAAFGWYKELEIKIKGHPLSNLSITALPYSKYKPEIFCQVHNDLLEGRSSGSLEQLLYFNQ